MGFAIRFPAMATLSHRITLQDIYPGGRTGFGPVLAPRSGVMRARPGVECLLPLSSVGAVASVHSPTIWEVFRPSSLLRKLRKSSNRACR
jgi:hypothetical protein